MPATQIHPKVLGATTAGAVTIIAVWLLSTYGHVTLPPAVSDAATIILTLLGGYIPSSPTA